MALLAPAPHSSCRCFQGRAAKGLARHVVYARGQAGKQDEPDKPDYRKRKMGEAGGAATTLACPPGRGGVARNIYGHARHKPACVLRGVSPSGPLSHDRGGVSPLGACGCGTGCERESAALSKAWCPLRGMRGRARLAMARGECKQPSRGAVKSLGGGRGTGSSGMLSEKHREREAASWPVALEATPILRG